MTEKEAKAIFEDGVAIKEKLPNLAPAYELAIKALNAQIKLKEYIERINQPEYNGVLWQKDDVVLLLKELVAK